MIFQKGGRAREDDYFFGSLFLRKKGVSLDVALSIVKEKRPSGHLNEVQKQFVIEFEKSLKDKGTL